MSRRGATNMSHELRTPLNAIIGYAELLREEAEDAGLFEQLPDLRRIEKTAHHLLSLINNVLDLSKIESGRMELILEPQPIAPIIDSVTATLEPLVHKRGNVLKIECPPTLPHAVVDEMRLKQVLTNLVGNAARFTGNGEITIEVEAHDATIACHVHDTGPGISQEAQERLFSPFEQEDRQTQRTFGGTGLGLTISRELCLLMHDTLEVESVLGEGATFTAIVPRA